LVGGGAWFSFNYLFWRIPPPPETHVIALADLDGDGDLDTFLGGDRKGRIWLNDGRGLFTDSGLRLNYSHHHAVALGDVDGKAQWMLSPASWTGHLFGSTMVCLKCIGKLSSALLSRQFVLQHHRKTCVLLLKLTVRPTTLFGADFTSGFARRL
jgi:hypothetical protein